MAEAGHDYSAPYWMGEFGTGDNGANWKKIGRVQLKAFLGPEHNIGFESTFSVECQRSSQICQKSSLCWPQNQVLSRR